MSKKQAKPEARSAPAAGVIDDNEGFEEDVSVTDETVADIDREVMGIAGELDSDDTPCNTMSAKVRERLETKKRLDAYLERKLLKESGWDDDDELFDDEYFSEIGADRI